MTPDTDSAKYKTIHRRHHHFGWNNALEPLLTVAPGAALEFDVLEASGGRITARSSAADIATLDPDYANPVTGPVYVDGAAPGDTLWVEVLGFGISGWGWTKGGAPAHGASRRVSGRIFTRRRGLQSAK